MPNSIKYSASAQTLALKKGNFWIGTGDVGKGPTSTTDYYNGITPPAGGYTIYLNKASGGPSIYTAANDSALISLSNTIAGQTFANAAAALAWFATQTDKMVFAMDYPAIITNGLYYVLDPGFTPSYPTSGTTIYDINASYNGTLVNGVAFSSNDGGTLSLDGTDDYILMPDAAGLNTNFTLSMFIKINTTTRPNNPIYGKGQDGIYGGWGIICEVQSSSMRTQIVANGSYYDVPASISYTSNTWEMWTIAWNSTNGTCKTYKGTTLAGNNSSITPGATLRGNTAVFIGAQGIGSNGGLPYDFTLGSFGTILMYNRELSSTEITQNYNALKGRFGL